MYSNPAPNRVWCRLPDPGFSANPATASEALSFIRGHRMTLGTHSNFLPLDPTSFTVLDDCCGAGDAPPPGLFALSDKPMETRIQKRCAYFIPRYATESLVEGRNAQEQRLIRHHVGEVTLVLSITLMPSYIYVPVGDSSHCQDIASLVLPWGFSPLKLKL